MYPGKLERMSLNEVLAINPYLLKGTDLVLLYRELIWRLRPMVFSHRADEVIRQMELVESLLCRILKEYYDDVLHNV